MTNPTTKTFTVGKTYETRSACDHECIHSFTILARTDKTVRVKVHGKEVSRRIYVGADVERFKPFGSYSMAAVISADREEA